MNKSKLIGIGAGIVIIGLIIAYTTSQVDDIEDDNAILERELAASTIDWNYYDLLKNIDELEGQVIHFTGNVNVGSKNGVFGINVADSSFKEDVVFVEYNKEQFVKHDVVEGYGYVKGVRNLEKTNALGGADILEIVPNIEGIIVSCVSC